MWCVPANDQARGGQRLLRPGLKLLVAAHGELELRAVRLDAVANACCGADRAPEDHVVHEDDVGRQMLPDRGRVRLDEAVALGPAEILHPLRLHALVAVEHEDGQDTPDVRPHRRCTAQIERLGMGLLGEDGDVVPEQ